MPYKAFSKEMIRVEQMAGELIDIKRYAQIKDMSEGRIRQLCQHGEFEGAVKVGSRWKLPAPAAGKENTKGQQKIIDSDELMNVPADKRMEAIKRLGIIEEFNRFAAKIAMEGTGKSGAIELFTAGGKATKRSLQRWINKYRTEGLLGLVDMRGGGRFPDELISPEAFEMFSSMYLTQQQLPLKVCWQNINYINRSQKRDWKVPSLQMMYKIADDRIPLPVKVLHREGLAAYEAKCAPYIEIDPDSIEPNQVWVGDHSQLNVWVRYGNKFVRPWVTAWEDMKSRLIVGWYISPIPNQTTILLSMKRAIEKFGPPESVKIDNGKDYDSELFTGTTKQNRKVLGKGYLDEKMLAGIYAMMDIGVSFAIPYNAKAKRIERLFATIDSQFTATFDLYCGKDTKRKPEDLIEKLKDPATSREAVSFEKLETLFASYVEVYNANSHSAKDMQEQSPAEVFQERRIHRILVPGVVDLLLRVWSRELMVGKNGVQFKGIYYGQYNTELLIHQGWKVRLSYDPDDLRRAYIYDSVTFKLITIAEQNQLINYGAAIKEESLRNAMREKRRVLRVAKDFRNSELTRNMDLTTLTIRAMQEVEKDRKQETGDRGQEMEGQQILQPIRTPLDDQVTEYERQKVRKILRKAAGAESMKEGLDIDFSVLNKKNRFEGVRLFNE
jgi:putative transposase